MAQLSPLNRKQEGSALIIGLILMLVMTMLGITAMQTTSLEERMAGNMRDRNLAVQAAEMALRAGEDEVLSGAVPSGNGVFDLATNPAPDPGEGSNWSGTNVFDWTNNKAFDAAIMSGSQVAHPKFTERPEFWIERRPPISAGASLENAIEKPVDIYEITSRSTGASGSAPVILRSTVML